jgi:hypothetical protein
VFCKFVIVFLIILPFRRREHFSISDLKGMAKVASGVLILRGGKSPDWTTDFDTQMNNWTTQYTSWLQTSPIALKEGVATK